MPIVTCLIEWGLLVIMIAGPGYVLWGRFKKREKEITEENGKKTSKGDLTPTGIGVRVIQLIGLFLLMPLVGILTLEGKLASETAGALIGVAIGYSLSGIEKAVPSKK